MEAIYNQSFYTSSELPLLAREYLNKLPEDINTLISIGYSGCAIASAMLALSKRPLWHVAFRKEKESGHDQVAGQPCPTNNKVAVVDDFCETGKTIACLIKQANSEGFTVKAILVSKCWRPTPEHLYTYIIEHKLPMPLADIDRRKERK